MRHTYVGTGPPAHRLRPTPGRPDGYAPPVGILERDHELTVLQDGLDYANRGEGRVVVISAEAGGGKTELARSFLGAASPARVLWGSCSDLATPLPFGPFLDIARQGDPALETLLTSGNRNAAINRLLDLLEQRPSPVVLVVEDIHWADQATVDALMFVADRIEQLPALLLLTMRAGEIEVDHPAQRLLWRLPPGATERLEPAALSQEAVAQLAPTLDASRIMAVTGGNPFFVSELIRSPNTLPPTVAEAVLARVIELPPSTRELLELVSIFPRTTPAEALDTLSPDWEENAEPAEMAGILEVGPSSVSFRHELARASVEHQLSSSRRRRLHGRVLPIIDNGAYPPAVVMHHAREAGDIERVLAVGPKAAALARSSGSHREAASHLEAVLEHGDRLADDDLAEMLELFTVEAWTVNRPEAAEAAAQRALEIRKANGHPGDVARNLRRIARVRWFLGAAQDAENLLDEALALPGLDAHPNEHAMTLAYRTLIAGIRHSSEAARRWSEPATELIATLDDTSVKAAALNDIGTVAYLHGGEPDQLLSSIDLAQTAGLHGDVVRGHLNMAVAATHHRHYGLAKTHLGSASAYAREHQVTAFSGLQASIRAQIAFETGEWDEADQLANDVLQQSSFARLPATLTLARLKVRRGDSDAAEAIAEAVRMAEETGEAQRLAPAVGTAAEHAWLLGRLDSMVPALLRAHEVTLRSGSPRWIGETAYWLFLHGEIDEMPAESELGAKSLAARQWDTCIRFWDEHGLPFEAAVARGMSDDVDDMLTGLSALDRLGAAPMAKAVRQRLKEAGVAKIPRGPRPSTAANPVGLTARQMDVMGLVIEGNTNAEIADRLYLSKRTVDHHVAAILGKLGVSSRTEVAGRAEELELTGA